jgi:cysteinyl-tRNA synthetase
LPTEPERPGAPLILFNSLTRASEAFRPLDPDLVRVYSCGPTVYNFAHLGNLRAYVFTDTLRRVLNWKGYAVNHVINITDVGHLTSDADAGEDKMELAAAGLGKDIWEVAAFYTAAFKADLAALGILPPTVWSTATDHIQEMIAFAERIDAGGHGYRLPGGLYFDTATVPDYGRLAGAAATAEAVGRIETVDGKRQPADFAIWRASPPGPARQMEWSSPWGRGAPGWHLECSVMSMKYLGRQFDIHTGGIDHREIHHCNEIAQNQAFTGTASTGATVWMHNNFLVDRGGKMSKSKGGFATLASLVDRGIHPLGYRLLCLAAHYRSELEFSGELVLAALTRLKRLVMAVEALRARAGPQAWATVMPEVANSRGASFDWARKVIEDGLPAPARAQLDRFDAQVAADLNLPATLPLIEAAAADKALAPEVRLRLIASMDLVAGFGLMHLTRRDLRIAPAGAAIAEDRIEARLAERQAARAARDFAAADVIRQELAEAGVEVMDGDPLGWDWRIDLG